MKSVDQHRHASPRTVRFAVCTVSDSRTEEDDRSGTLIRETMREAGHHEVAYTIVRDEVVLIGEAIDSALSREDVDVLILTGGTGISARDVTSDVVEALPGIRLLPGFGELFRMLSFEEVGAAAMLSRAMAGICQGTAIFALPGSSNAVRLAMRRLIVPEIGHVVGMMKGPGAAAVT